MGLNYLWDCNNPCQMTFRDTVKCQGHFQGLFNAVCIGHSQLHSRLPKQLSLSLSVLLSLPCHWQYQINFYCQFQGHWHVLYQGLYQGNCHGHCKWWPVLLHNICIMKTLNYLASLMIQIKFECIKCNFLTISEICFR